MDNWTVRPLERSVVGVRWLKITCAHTHFRARTYTHTCGSGAYESSENAESRRESKGKKNVAGVMVTC